MSNIYRRLPVRLWGDGRFVALSPLQPSGQSLYLFLLTGPHTVALPGVCSVGRAALAEALGWSPETFDAAFQELAVQQLAEADWRARLVFLPGALADNEPASPNVVTHWSKAFALLPECDLRRSIGERVTTFLEQLGPSWVAKWRAVHSHHAQASEASAKPSPKPFEKASGNQEQKQEQQQEKKRKQSDPWAKTLKGIEAKVTRHDFYSWFKDTQLLEANGHGLVVSVKNPMTANWIKKHFGAIVRDALTSAVDEQAGITWRPREKDPD
jgi:hypothetical protein